MAKPCPSCGASDSITVTIGIERDVVDLLSVEADNVRTVELPDNPRARMTCQLCKTEWRGHLENATFNLDGILAGGHFVEGGWG